MYLWDPIVDDDSSDYIAAVALKLATYERIFAPCRSSTTAGRAGDAQCGFKLSSRGAAHILFPRQHLATRIFNVEFLRPIKASCIPVAELPVIWYEATGSRLNFVRDSTLMLRDLLILCVNQLLER